jgi:hypothetical protein
VLQISIVIIAKTSTDCHRESRYMDWGRAPMEVKKGQKFAVIALEDAASELSRMVELEPGLAIALTPPVQFSDL